MILPRHQLDHPGAIKIALGVEESAAINANGRYHLAMISRGDATTPADARGRVVLTCLPLPIEVLNQATRVALGKARAVSVKPPQA
jgi:hypothetical protein